jgi:hypothetical protein
MMKIISMFVGVRAGKTDVYIVQEGPGMYRESPLSQVIETF